MSSFWQQTRQIYDRLLCGSKHSAEVVAESLRRRAAMQKLAARIRGLNRERSRLIRSIGKKVYSLHTRGQVRNRDVLSDCVRIDEAGQEIEALQEQIEELRREAVAGEELVVKVEDEAPVTEEPEEEAGAVEPPEPSGEELVMETEGEAPVAEEVQEEEGEVGPWEEQGPQPQMGE